MPSNSTIDSNIVAKAGTETISNFASISGTALVGALTGDVTGNVVGASVKATSFLKLGAGTGCKYLVAGAETVQASIVIAMRAIMDVTASAEGSIYLAKDNIWHMTSTTLATPITVP